MPVRLDGPIGSLVFGGWAELGGSSRESLPVPSPAWLRLAIAEQLGAAASLRSLLHELGELDLEFADEHELAERVVGLIERGCLRVVAERSEPMATEPGERAEAGEPEQPEPTAEVRLHWVEVMIVGEDDEGIAGVRCEVTLPDGRRCNATTDREGLIRIDGILDAGACTVRFPDLDRRAWEPA